MLEHVVQEANDAKPGKYGDGASVLKDLQAMPQKLGPALLQEVRAGKAQGRTATRIEAIRNLVAALPQGSPLLETGSREFPSSSNPKQSYTVSFGRADHLQCNCPGFEYRGECKHVLEVRKRPLAY